MKKVSLIYSGFLGLLVYQSNMDASLLIRTIAIRAIHTSSFRARYVDHYEMRTSLERTQEKRLNQVKDHLLEIMRRNTELTNIEINGLKAKIQQLENDRVAAHRNNAIIAGDLLDKKMR